MPRRGRDVRALLQPGLLRQPARLHVPPARRVRPALGRGARRGRRLAADPTDVFVRRARGRRRCSARSRSGCCCWAGARLLRPRRGADRRARCWRSRSCPCTTATWRSTTCRRWRRCALALLGVALVLRDGGACAATRWPARRSGSPARPSTRRGSSSCRSWRRRSCRPRRAARSCAPAGWRSPGGSRSPASCSPTRTRCSTSRRFRDGLRHQARRRATAAASSAYRPTAGSSTTSDRDLGAGLAAGAGRASAGPWLASRDRGSRSCWSRRRSLFLLFMGLAGPLLRPLAAAGLPLLCLLAAWAAVAAAAGSRRGAAALPAVAALGAALCVQGLVFSIHNDIVAQPAPTRAARARLDGRNIPTARRS